MKTRNLCHKRGMFSLTMMNCSYEGTFTAARLSNFKKKRFELELQLSEKGERAGAVTKTGSALPAQTQTPRTTSDGSMASPLRSMLDISAAYTAFDEGQGASPPATPAKDGEPLPAVAEGAKDAIEITVANETAVEIALFADNLRAFTTREVRRIAAGGGEETLRVSPGHVLRAVADGKDIWEVEVTADGPRSLAIATPIGPDLTPFQCDDSVRELLDSVVHREHRVDALAKLIELSEGMIGIAAGRTEAAGQGQLEGDARTKLRVGLAFAAADGCGILLPLLCHPDEQLRVGALELLASVCDLPTNRKQVVHLLFAVVDMIATCGRQEALVAVIAALDSACRDSPHNSHLVGDHLQDGLARGDMAVPVLAAFVEMCDGSAMGMAAQMLLRHAKVKSVSADLGESGHEFWIAQLMTAGWYQLAAPAAIYLGTIVYFRRFGEGRLWHYDSYNMNIDFDISGSKTVSIASGDVLASPASDVATQLPIWEERGGQASVVRRNLRLARAEDVAAWMAKQTGGDGRVCEFYAGVLYRAGVNGKMLTELTEHKLAELDMMDEGHIAAVLTRCLGLKGFLSRYVIEEGPSIYESKETRVIRALDRLSSASGRRGMGQQVALKIVVSASAFEQELRARSLLGSGAAVPLLRVHVPSKYTWPPGTTAPSILQRTGSGSGSGSGSACTADLDEDSSQLDARLGGQFVFVFECADFNLESFFSSQSKKGPVDLSEARDVLSAAASRLRQCEEGGFIHGDASLSNFVSKSGRLLLVDFDLSQSLGDSRGAFQRGCCPPEVAARWGAYVEYTAEYKQITPVEKIMGWDDWLATYASLPASTAVDVWGFGVVMYQLLSSKRVAHRSLSDPETVADWDDVKEHFLQHVADGEGRDLLSWCLQSTPARRPTGFSEVLAHPFISPDGNGSLRYPVPVEQCALRLHQAIEDGNAGRRALKKLTVLPSFTAVMY